MDWLFKPIGRFFNWTFGIIEGVNMVFNITMIVIGGLLILYWIFQMYKNRRNDKGFFRKPAN